MEFHKFYKADLEYVFSLKHPSELKKFDLYLNNFNLLSQFRTLFIEDIF